jgi:hypothetical protein
MGKGEKYHVATSTTEGAEQTNDEDSKLHLVGGRFT